MKIWIWFLLSCKRQLKHPFFVLMLVVMPVLLVSMKGLESRDAGAIRIAVYQQDQQDPLSRQTIDQLLNQTGMFEFYECESKQQLQDDVASKRAECGYLFTEQLQEKLTAQKFKRSIEVYSAPSTITADLSKEVVFSHLMDVYYETILEHFITQTEFFTAFDQTQALADLYQLYQAERVSGNTFSFQYEALTTKESVPSEGMVAFPVRGMVAVYLLVVSLFAAVSSLQDEKNGLFTALPGAYRLFCKMVSLAAPVVLAAGSALVAILATGSWTNSVSELVVMCVYVWLLVLFGYGCRMVVKEPVALCGLIPFFILGSLVFCPVFIDVTRWVPQVAGLRYLFLPYYYLQMF